LNDLVKRTLTGAVFVAVLITGSIYNKWSFFGLFLLICVAAIKEYIDIFKTKYEDLSHILPILGGASIFCLVFFDHIMLAAAVLCLLVPFIMINELFANNKDPLQNIAVSATSLFYITIPLSLLILLTNATRQYSFQPLLGSLFLVWSADTGAYLAGRAFGKHKLYERISPNKTWEGAIGGFLLCISIGYVISLYFTILSNTEWMGLGAVVSVFGVIGDLIESQIKRNLNIKDSGNILPGHGGILDRFDAFIFCIPFIYLYFQLTA